MHIRDAMRDVLIDWSAELIVGVILVVVVLVAGKLVTSSRAGWIGRIKRSRAIRKFSRKKPLPLATWAVAEACERFSEYRVSKVWSRDDRYQVPREAKLAEFHGFLSAADRWCAITGEARSGKTTFLGLAARHAAEKNWAVLALVETEVDWNYAATNLKGHLPYQTEELAWEDLLVGAWTSTLGDFSGLLVAIDGVGERLDPKQLSQHLELLGESLSRNPSAKVKCVFSCQSQEWLRLRRWRPFTPHMGVVADEPDLLEIEVGGFTDQELERAYAELKWGEFTHGMYIDGEPRYPLQALNDLLREPVAFGLYLELRLRGERGVPSGWVELLCLEVEQLIDRAARESPALVSSIRNAAALLGRLSLAEHSMEATLVVGKYESELTELRPTINDPTQSLIAALIEGGLLVRTPDELGVKFASKEKGSYCLAISLDHELRDVTSEDLPERVQVLIDQAIRGEPLLDALLILCSEGFETKPEIVRAVLGGLVSAQGVRQDVIFGLAPAFVAEELFRRVGDEQLWAADKALLSLQPTQELEERIAHQLRGGDFEPTLVAIKMAAHHQLTNLIGEIVTIASSPLDQFDDTRPESWYQSPRQEIRDTALDAIAKFGEDAHDEIVRRLTEVADESETKWLWAAMRKCGFRSAEVEHLLAQREAKWDGDDSDVISDILRSAVVLRAGLAPKTLEQCLQIDNADVQWLALKQLTLNPAPALDQFLLPFLESLTFVDGELIERERTLARQASFALISSRDPGSRAVVVETLENCVAGNGRLPPREAVEWVMRLGATEAIGSVIHQLSTYAVRRDRASVERVLIHLRGDLERELVQAVQRGVKKEFESGTDLPQLLAEMITDSDAPLDEFHTRSAIWLIAISEVQSRTAVLAELLNHLEWPLDQTVAKMLGEIGDPTTEDAVLKKLDTWLPGAAESSLSDTGPLYSLGSVGREQSVAWIEEFLNHAQDRLVRIEFPGFVLVPLLSRGVMSQDTLRAIARDTTASESGRIAAVAALAEFDPVGNSELFDNLLRESVGPAFTRYLIRASGEARSFNSVTQIEDRARAYIDDPWICTVAVEVLVGLGGAEHEPFALEAWKRHRESDYAFPINYALSKIHPAGAVDRISFLLGRGSTRVRDWRLLGECIWQYWNPSTRAEMLISQITGHSDPGFDRYVRQASFLTALWDQDAGCAAETALEALRRGQFYPLTRQILSSLLVRENSSTVDRDILGSLVTLLLEDTNWEVVVTTRETLERFDNLWVRSLLAKMREGTELSEARAIGALAYITDEVSQFSADRAASGYVRFESSSAKAARRSRKASSMYLEESVRMGCLAPEAVSYLRKQMDQKILIGLKEIAEAHPPTRASAENAYARVKENRRRYFKDLESKGNDWPVRAGWISYD